MNFHSPKYDSRRSNVLARNGMVATSQPLAAQAGLDVLKAGGNAVDAAIATAATLCVVEPGSTGLGGDAFALIWSAEEGALYGLNASGPAPAGLSVELVHARGHETMPVRGALPVTVPGALRGWQLALERFGTRGLDSLLARSIDYARNGFPVSEIIAAAWAKQKSLLGSDPNSRRVYLSNGQAPRAGELFANQELASTLTILAEQGYDAFYGGPIGGQIVDCLHENGGVMTVDDLAAYQAQWVEPISVPYRNDFVFHEIPPNGQGLAALLALNLVQGFDLTALGRNSADTWHILIEAMKLAFVDAFAYIADPAHVNVPAEKLLSQEYTDGRRSLISLGEAHKPGPGLAPDHSDTVYLTVADGQGNMVSWIQSLYLTFGCGLTAGSTGISLHNRGANFVLTPGHPNRVGPGKRPYHTIIPGFITYQGNAWSSFGVMGGFMQPQGHLQVGINLIEFGMDPQTALDAPRFRWLLDGKVALEPSAGPVIYQDLAARGHHLLPQEEAAALALSRRSASAAAISYGGGQIIVRDPDTGILIGGSEPRKDGAAVGW